MQTKRQKEILDTALNLIGQRGIQGLTIKNLSKEIGISEPAIYRHYDSKIDILLAILDVFRQNTEKLYDNASKKDIPAPERLSLIFSRHFDTFSENPALIPVIFSEEVFRGEEGLMDKVSEIITRNIRTLSGIIKEGQKNNEIRDDIDAGHIAVIIMGSLRLFIKKWQFAGYSYDIKREGRKLVKSLKRLIIKGNSYEIN